MKNWITGVMTKEKSSTFIGFGHLGDELHHISTVNLPWRTKWTRRCHSFPSNAMVGE